MNYNTKNIQLELAYEFVQNTDKNIFLTGKAGTGKTTFLHNLKAKSPKRMVVVAPTGVAAINAGGVTIHSFFQMPFGPFIPEAEIANQSIKKFNRQKIDLIRSLDLLVIDEISMVRSDLLDGIDSVLRRYKDRNKPFGGVQLLMIGDLHQLAPIVKDEEWEILKEYYKSMFFFDSLALQKADYVSIELKTIYRQSDETFISLLNKVRENNMDSQTLDELNKRYVPGITNSHDEGTIILTTHNYQSQSINEGKLNKLSTKKFTFMAQVEGEFAPYMYPTESSLVLKVGAQVMFIKNDSSKEKLYYNGKIGTITKIGEDGIFVKSGEDDFEIVVKQEEWQNSKYELNVETKEIQENVIGTFTQYPLKLAWAITIHKSQGLTFEKAIIDANSAFAFGQVYVALSRCKTLEGLFLSTPISENSIIQNKTISHFTELMEDSTPDFDKLEEAKFEYQKSLVYELFDFHNLKYRLASLMKNMSYNSSSIDSKTIETLTIMENAIKPDILDISEKFKVQLEKLLSDKNCFDGNSKLQEKIRKASQHFKEKIESNVFEYLRNISIETDNKSVKKMIAEDTTRLYEESFVKHSCMKLNGFDTKKYLETKAKSSINIPPLKVPTKAENVHKSIGSHTKLYNRLKQWRNKVAKESNIEVYRVLQIKSMDEIVERMPVSLAELERINGIGKQKLKNYGKEILEIILDYCKENNLKNGLDKID
ncbi:MAG: HRDC domain-containing protein [Leptospiraceae bacterium]|nr:HRDC domain-containing protein [Leptospiraceae bacterium]